MSNILELRRIVRVKATNTNKNIPAQRLHSIGCGETTQWNADALYVSSFLITSKLSGIFFILRFHRTTAYNISFVLLFETR